MASNTNAEQIAPPNESSATTTLTSNHDVEPEIIPLRLSAAPHVQWAEGTVDNEHLNRKSSKRCCIFHKPKKFGESSSESESEGESDGDKKPLARKKQGEISKKQQVPDFQRFHA